MIRRQKQRAANVGRKGEIIPLGEDVLVKGDPETGIADAVKGLPFIGQEYCRVQIAVVFPEILNFPGDLIVLRCAAASCQPQLSEREPTSLHLRSALKQIT